MVFEINEKYNLLVLKTANSKELFTLDKVFNKTVDNWHFKKKYIKSGWDGKVEFFADNKYLPLGLRNEIKVVAKRFKYPVKIINEDKLYDNDINYQDFKKVVLDFFSNHEITPYDYQIQTAYKILKNKKCLAELATSAGKTLITFITFLYQIIKNPESKILMIVPGVSLVEQAMDDMYDYNISEQIKINIQPIYSGTKIIENANIVIGTYQSLVKKKLEYFKQFTSVVVDEVHKTTAKSIRLILQNCLHCDYRYGVSGTIQKPETIDRWNVMSYLGPIITEVKAKQLMNSGHITKLKVYVTRIQYDDKKFSSNLYKLSYKKDIDPTKILTLEKNYIHTNINRLKIISKLIKSFNQGNVLVMFRFVNYGKIIRDFLKKNITDKSIYYIDGSTDEKTRQFYKSEMEKRSDIILIASYGTTSTGISIKNVTYGILAESVKDEKILRQTIGRLLRKHINKKKSYLIDLIDNLSHKRKSGTVWENYYLRHGHERINVYNSERFDYELRKIKLK